MKLKTLWSVLKRNTWFSKVSGESVRFSIIRYAINILNITSLILFFLFILSMEGIIFGEYTSDILFYAIVLSFLGLLLFKLYKNMKAEFIRCMRIKHRDNLLDTPH